MAGQEGVGKEARRRGGKVLANIARVAFTNGFVPFTETSAGPADFTPAVRFAVTSAVTSPVVSTKYRRRATVSAVAVAAAVGRWCCPALANPKNHCQMSPSFERSDACGHAVRMEEERSEDGVSGSLLVATHGG